MSWDGHSVAQPAMHSLQTSVSLLATGQGNHNLSRTHVWVSIHVGAQDVTARLALLLHPMLRFWSLGASFGKGSWVPSSWGAESVKVTHGLSAIPDSSFVGQKLCLA